MSTAVPTPLRVAMVETGGWGGIAHYAWNLCAALAHGSTEVRLLTHVRYELDGLARRFSVDRCLEGGAGYARSARTLWCRLADFAPDIVHVQSPLSSRFDWLFWPFVRRRAALVWTAHNVRGHERAGWEGGGLWRCLASADGVVVHTRESVAEVRARLGSRPRVALVHHGDYAFFGAAEALDRHAARARVGLPLDGRPLLLCFGAIRPYKGVLGVIEALASVRAHHPGATLVVAGPMLVGSANEYVEAIQRARLQDAVVLRARYVPHADVAAYFAAADVAVYNYRDVTDSGSLRIACSLGTPVVATGVGGFREFLVDRVSGRLVPPGSPAALAAAIVEVLDDKEAARRMAERARALAASAWSWRDAAEATLALYGEVVEARGPGARFRRGPRTAVRRA